MRVMFWTELFWPYTGGIEVWSTGLLSALRSRGHEVVVLTRRDRQDLPAREVRDGIEIHRFPFWAALSGRDAGTVRKVRRDVSALKHRFGPDVIHLNTLGPSAYFHLATAANQTAAVLLSVHGFPRQPVLPDTVPARVLQASDWVATNSAALLAELCRQMPDIRSRASVIPCGRELRVPLRRQSMAEPHVVCLGRLVREKGFDVALDAVHRIAGRVSGLRVTIAGDGPLRTTLVEQTARLGLDGVVTFAGAVAPEDVPSLLGTASIVLIPSRLEALGLVAIEAALVGCPVIASRTGGLPEVVVHGESGLLVEPEDCHALASAACSLLTDPDTAERMGRTARARASTRFALDRHVEAYGRLYATLGRKEYRDVECGTTAPAERPAGGG